MSIMVKTNNGDIERFPDSMTFEVTQAMSLILRDSSSKVTAIFAPGGWAGVFHEENVVRRYSTTVGWTGGPAVTNDLRPGAPGVQGASIS